MKKTYKPRLYFNLFFIIAAALMTVCSPENEMSIPDSGGYVNGFNVNLSNITLSSGTLLPSFRYSSVEYTATVEYEVDSITLTPTASDIESAINVIYMVNDEINTVPVISGAPSENINLNTGDNIVSIKVTAKDKSYSKTYKLTINRKQPGIPSSIADLAGIGLSTGTLEPGFKKTIMNYSVEIGNMFDSVDITPTSADTAAAITIDYDGNTGEIITHDSGTAFTVADLEVDITRKIYITVTAENGTQKLYTVSITRKSISTNANLASITFAAGTMTPDFLSGTYTGYILQVPFEVTSLTITPASASDFAEIEVNGQVVLSNKPSQTITTPEPGTDQPIEIQVTAEDTTTKHTYVITLRRSAASSDASLDYLSLTPGALVPSFNSTEYNYTVRVANSAASLFLIPTPTHEYVKSITVNGEPADPGEPFTIQNLEIGENPIVIIVTAQDSSTTETYNINVIRLKKIDINISFSASLPASIKPVVDETLYVKLFYSQPGSWSTSGSQSSVILSQNNITSGLTLSPEFFVTDGTPIYAGVFVDKNSNGRPDFGEPAQFYSSDSYYSIVKTSGSLTDVKSLPSITIDIAKYNGDSISLDGTFNKELDGRDWKIAYMPSPSDIGEFLADTSIDWASLNLHTITPDETTGVWEYTNQTLTVNELLFVAFTVTDPATQYLPDENSAVYLYFHTLDSSSAVNEFDELSNINFSLSNLYIMSETSPANKITVSGTFNVSNIDPDYKYDWYIYAFEGIRLRGFSPVETGTGIRPWTFPLYKGTEPGYTITLMAVGIHKTDSSKVQFVEWDYSAAPETSVLRTILDTDIPDIALSSSTMKGELITLSGSLNPIGLADFPNNYNWVVYAYKNADEINHCTVNNTTWKWNMLIEKGIDPGYDITLCLIGTHKTLPDTSYEFRYWDKTNGIDLLIPVDMADISGIVLSTANLEYQP
jgi:hypothetical protein